MPYRMPHPVSSTRSTISPPWWRANSQLNSAERALPTWRKPVGAGAKITQLAQVPAGDPPKDYTVFVKERGTAYLGGPPLRAHFGLGSRAKADYIRLAWNDALHLVQHREAPNLYWALATMPFLGPIISIASHMALKVWVISLLLWNSQLPKSLCLVWRKELTRTFLCSLDMTSISTMPNKS